MQRIGLRDEAKEQVWRERLTVQQASGLSQLKFCTQEGLNANTFSSWKKTLEKRDGAKRRAQVAKNDRQRAYRERNGQRLFVQVAPRQEQVPVPTSAPPNRRNTHRCLVAPFLGDLLPFCRSSILAVRQSPLTILILPSTLME